MKNKNIFIIPLAIIIVICVVYTNTKNHNNNIIPEKISVSTTKNTSKNMISNLSNYPDKILEIKKEVLTNEKQYVITGWINTNHIDISINSIKLDLFPYSHLINCFAINMNISRDKVYIIKDNEEKLIATKDVSNWQNDQWINYKVYATVEQASTIERVFRQLIGDEAQASCYTIENLKNIKKIVFQMPEAKEKQTIEATEIYMDDKWDSDKYTIAVAKENQNLSLLIKDDKNISDIMPEQPFFRGISLNNQKVFIRLIDGELLEIKNIKKSIPFLVLKDYVLEGRSYCSKFNGYCVFSIEKLIANTTLKKDEKNITAPFEHTFNVNDYIFNDKITLYVSKNELDYLNIKSESVMVDLKNFLNNLSIEETNGHKHITGNLYIKGNIICKITTKSTLNCIIDPDIIEMK